MDSLPVCSSRLWIALLIGAIGLQPMPGQEPAKSKLPDVPIQLSPPPTPAKKRGELDLTQFRSSGLASFALQASKQGNYETAIHFQHWAVANGDGDTGMYNLACFYSLAGNVDGSIYWLQQAAVAQGVDPAWASKDSDLATVREDARWAKLHNYLIATADYWQSSDLFETQILLPQGYDGLA